MKSKYLPTSLYDNATHSKNCGGLSKNHPADDRVITQLSALFKKMFSGDSLRTTYNSREGASNRTTEALHCKGKTCSGPAGSQYSVCWPIKHSTAFSPVSHLLNKRTLCVTVQRREYSEMLNRNSDTLYVRVEVGETRTLTVAAMWTSHSPRSPAHLLSFPALRSTCSPASWMAGSWRHWMTV